MFDKIQRTSCFKNIIVGIWIKTNVFVIYRHFRSIFVHFDRKWNEMEFQFEFEFIGVPRITIFARLHLYIEKELSMTQKRKTTELIVIEFLVSNKNWMSQNAQNLLKNRIRFKITAFAAIAVAKKHFGIQFKIIFICNSPTK